MFISLKNKVRFILVLGYCLFLLLFVAGGDLLVCMALARIRKPDPSVFRASLFHWQTTWTEVLLRRFCTLARVNISCILPPPIPAQPLIVLANHRSWLDIFLVARALHQTGCTRISAIVKEEITRVPVIGAFSKGIRCAHITRKNRELDIARIKQGARDAREDNAAIVLFPEGTRLSNTTSTKEEEQRLQKPKIGGLTALLEELPTVRVLACAIVWPKNKSVRTIMQGASLVDSHIQLVVETIPTDGKSPGDVLNDAWSRIHSHLA